MNKLSKIIVNSNSQEWENAIAMLRGSIPSITELHEAAHRAKEKWLKKDSGFVRAYNRHVLNSKLPSTFGEFLLEEFTKVNINPVIKQAYWKACWWGADKEFRYPRKERVAAMMFRC